MHLRTTDYALWITTPFVLSGVVFLLRKRGLSTEFPIFYGYLLFQIVTDILLLTIERFSYVAYYYTYWATTVLGVLFTFALIDELFRVAFRDFTAVRNLGTYIFRWGALLLLLGALATAAGFPHADGSYGISFVVLMGDRVARAMLCLMAMLLLLGARKLYIPVRSTLFGIALGFFVYMFGKVVLDSITLQHFSWVRLTSRINTLVYIASCFLWMIYAQCGIQLPSHSVAAVSSLSAAERGPLAGRLSLLEALNSIVEETMRKTGKTP